MEGSSQSTLLYHSLVAEFLGKILVLTEDMILSFKEVLSVLLCQAPLTPRCFSLMVPFSSPFLFRFSDFHQKLVNRHLRSGFRKHLQETLAQISPLWHSLGQAVLFDSRLLRFSHEAIVVGTNLKNHRVAFVFVTQFNSLLELVNSSLGLTSLDEVDSEQSLPPVVSPSNLVGGDLAVSEEVSETPF